LRYETRVVGARARDEFAVLGGKWLYAVMVIDRHDAYTGRLCESR